MASRANRVAHFGTTIFSDINTRAAQHQAINLGQGRPDFDAPPDIIASAVTALHSGQAINQYASGLGSANLRTAVANHAGRFYNLDVDPTHGVLVTAGATEAIFSSVLGLVDVGDEVIIIEPFFDSYLPNITMAGAVPVYVPLHPPAWTFDPDELRAAFTPRTRALILNTPHNPTGRVFSRAELQMIADLCIEHDVTVISDEVYEHLVFDDTQHIPIASLPDMFERTITVSSAGKSFSVTGWKIGWVYGPTELVGGVTQAHQYVTFAVNHPAQEAAAYALNQPNTYFEEFQAFYTAKRTLMLEALQAGGFTYTVPEGTYFVMGDFAALSTMNDVDFAYHLIEHVGVAAIPMRFFYCAEHAHIGAHFLRFAFCKSDQLLRAAAAKLARLHPNKETS
jgi:N-succinyldiaminopimelate aminotransferase